MMRTQARAGETHTRILVAAADAIARMGYEATSVDSICQAAGVTKGGFYHHFASKQALFLELLERWLAWLDVQLDAAGAGAETVPERLLRMSALGGRVFQQRRGQLRILLEFWEQAAHDPAVLQTATLSFRRYQALCSAIIEAGIADGTLCPVDAHVAGQAIVSLSTGLIVQGVLDPEGSDWAQVVTESMRLLVEGLRRQ